MPTNLAIDDRLIAEAQKLGHHRGQPMSMLICSNSFFPGEEG